VVKRAVQSAWSVAVMLAAACAPSASPAREADAFEAWQAADPAIAADVRAFGVFLADERVADILPMADLLRSDRDLASDACPIAAYVMPPRETWPQLVSTLKLVRDVVVPAVGPVRVVSGYRPEDFNTCIRGAARSAHLTFGALDLVPVSSISPDELYGALCATWAREPSTTNMGLGTYFDRAQPERNREGRFHVDTTGRRTWGYDYRAASSYCVSS